MDSKIITNQRTIPRVLIYSPLTGKSTPKFDFSLSGSKVLQSYQFSMSVNDITGSFSLTFYPDSGMERIFDAISQFDIVEIYEPYRRPVGEMQKPAFIGVVRKKRYYTSMSNNGGAVRKISVSGTGITGLVSQLEFSLDANAQMLSPNYIDDESLDKGFTLEFMSDENMPVKNAVISIWNKFIGLAGAVGNSDIASFIATYLGAPDSFFTVDDSRFRYPVASIFRGQCIKNFEGIIDDLIPYPAYERFAYMDMADGRMKIMIRRCPFDPDKWEKLAGNKRIESRHLVSFSVEQSDDEVYSVFYAYLNGYPLDDAMQLRLSFVEENRLNSIVQIDADKFKRYGYKPLNVHFIGYGTKDGKTDTGSVSAMEDESKKIQSWYADLPDMLSGSIDMIITADTPYIQPGDVVDFLDGQFYVDGISHSWNYGTAGTVNLTVSRGGRYINGKFSRYNGITDKITDLENLRG